MTQILVPRTAWYGSRLPCNNDGTTTRARLPKPVAGGLAVHYTGSYIRVRNSTDDAKTYMTWMQASAIAQSKSFEYNDIIPPRVDGSSQVWEYAGDYMAAHAGSVNNMHWYAIQFALGVNNHPSQPNHDPLKPITWQPLTDAMVDAFRWRRHDLVERGLLAANHEVRPHQKLPTAATACPGNAILSRWDDLMEPWTEPQPPEDDMPELFTLKELPAPLYQRVGNVVRWISPDVWAVIGRPAPTRIMPEDEAKTYFISGPSPDGSGAFLAQVA